MRKQLLQPWSSMDGCAATLAMVKRGMVVQLLQPWSSMDGCAATVAMVKHGWLCSYCSHGQAWDGCAAPVAMVKRGMVVQLLQPWSSMDACAAPVAMVKRGMVVQLLQPWSSMDACAATAAMVKHRMVCNPKLEFLNYGHISVTIFDEAYYAIAKLVQWKWPNTHGEDKYVVMLGSLYIVGAHVQTTLEASRWTTALTENG